MNYKGYIVYKIIDGVIFNLPSQVKLGAAKVFSISFTLSAILLILGMWISYEINEPEPVRHPIGYVKQESIDDFQRNIDHQGYTMIYGTISNAERIYLAERGINCGKKMEHTRLKDKYVCK